MEVMRTASGAMALRMPPERLFMRSSACWAIANSLKNGNAGDARLWAVSPPE